MILRHFGYTRSFDGLSLAGPAAVVGYSADVSKCLEPRRTDNIFGSLSLEARLVFCFFVACLVFFSLFPVVRRENQVGKCRAGRRLGRLSSALLLGGQAHAPSRQSKFFFIFFLPARRPAGLEMTKRKLFHSSVYTNRRPNWAKAAQKRLYV